MYMATSKSYMDILKKQFSLAPDALTTNTNNNRPPRKRHAAILDYDSDQSATSQLITTTGTTSTTSTSTGTPTMQSQVTNTPDYAAEMFSLKNKIQQL